MDERHEGSSRHAHRSDPFASDLVFAPDDEADPTEITVYPERPVDDAAARPDTTAWLTMDVEHVVDLGEHA
jgi:hypothetical protein